VGCLTRRFPFGGSRIRAVSESPLPKAQWPLVELGALESYELRSSRRIGLPAPITSRCFQRLDGFPSGPSPVPLRDRVHPLSSLTSPSEFVLLVTCPTQVPSAFLGVSSPLRDKSVWSPLLAGLPAPDYVPSSAFLALSTACSSTHRVGLFHPTATSGIRSSGAFPAAKPARLIGESCPHVVSQLLLTASCPAAASSTRSAFRALIRAAIRCELQAV
jgi:hypothetical protein